MSFQAMAWAIKQATGDPASKLLLLTLANYTNDDGKAWPSQKTLARDTEMSERSIRNHSDKLVGLGLMSVETHKHSGGTKLTYWLGPAQGKSTPPADAAAPHRQILPVPPADVAADPIIEPIKEPTQGRATRLPEDWSPADDLLLWAKQAFPNVSIPDELETFRNHFLSTGKSMLRWDYAFRNWVRKSVEFAKHRAPASRTARLAGADLDAHNRASISRQLDDLNRPKAPTANRLFG
jgi:hypothetical protein